MGKQLELNEERLEYLEGKPAPLVKVLIAELNKFDNRIDEMVQEVSTENF